MGVGCVQYALAKMGLPTLPGGGMDARARANIVIRYKPTILLCTPSYALHLGRTVEALGIDPRSTPSARFLSLVSRA